jgi:hypothetical protein
MTALDQSNDGGMKVAKRGKQLLELFRVRSFQVR